FISEDGPDGLDFLEVTHRRGGGVRVDVVHWQLDVLQRHAHAAFRTFAGGRHHVETVGGGAIAHHLGPDAGAARLGVFELLENQNAGASGNDETITRRVVAARGLFGGLVEVRAHGAHGVEQVRKGPVEILVATSEDDVLLAQHDLFHGIADAVLGRRAGGG